MSRLQCGDHPERKQTPPKTWMSAVIYLLALLLLVLLIYAPQLWIKYVLAKHATPLAHLPGTGGELASHLIERFQLSGVGVETTAPNTDHYDDRDKMVRLSPDIFHGKSLTAIAVAAHEVGHAIQYHRQEKITRLRQRYTPLALRLERIAIGILFAMPLITALLRVPQAALLAALVGVIGMLASVLVQFIILPLEWDASFNKALPILVNGGYIDNTQEKAVRQVLRAAAFTYVAGALANILRLWRWLAILRGAIR